MTDEEMNVIQAARRWRHAMTTDNLMALIKAVDDGEGIEEAQAAYSEGADAAPSEPGTRATAAPASDSS